MSGRRACRAVMRRANGAATLTVALLAGVAQAADWELNPRLEAGYLFDDNYRLTPPGTEIEVQGPLADAQLEFRARNPAGEFSFTPRVRATYFPDQQDLDSVDYFGTLDWQHRGLRFRSAVRGEFAQQDVVNSEQPDAQVPGDVNLGEPDLGDSGRVLVENRRTRFALRPTFEHDLSERHTLEFGANYADVSYDNEIPGAQIDYDYADLTAGLATRLSPISSLTVRVRGARYDIETRGDSTSYGAELQWDRRTAADNRAFLRAGAQQVQLAAGGSDTAWLAGGGVNLLLGRNQLFADLSRSVGPSSAGIVVARDQLRVNWMFDMTPRLALLAGLRGTHDEDVDRDSDYRARSYATADVGLLWRWRQEFSVRVAYDYTWQEFDDALTDASQSSGAVFSILYQPLQRRR